MTHQRYSLSFTSGGLPPRESLLPAELYQRLGDWSAVRQRVMADNLLQARTLNTANNRYREIASRLKKLSPAKLACLTSAGHHEQNCLLWLAVCHRYSFIADFAVEVLREHFHGLQTQLTHGDFDAFFSQKAAWHPEVDAVTPATA